MTQSDTDAREQRPAGAPVDGGSSVVVVTSGIARKPGMSRDDLLRTNMGIVKSVVEQAVTASPDAIFIIDTNKEEIAVKEANKLAIPVVAIVDTNCSPEGVDYIIPGNDDALRAVRLFASRIADAIAEGQVPRDVQRWFDVRSSDGSCGHLATEFRGLAAILV